MLLGRNLAVLRHGAVVALAPLAALASPAAAKLQVAPAWGVFDRVLDPNPTSTDYGRWPVSVTSTVTTFTFAYNGPNSDGIVVQGIGTVGANATDFNVLPPRSNSSDCTQGGRVAFGGSCTIQVTFTPATTGQRVATLEVTDSEQSTNDVPLSGTGVLLDH